VLLALRYATLGEMVTPVEPGVIDPLSKAAIAAIEDMQRLHATIT
jgi:hypothetical protein